MSNPKQQLSDQELADQYLIRLKLDPSVVRASAKDVDLLAKLHDHHVTSIPFENLDQHTHPFVAPNLPEVPCQWTDKGDAMLSDPRVSIRKFIREPADLRGGFCFELNVPFAWLLTQLGFDVHLRLSQVCFGENPGAAGTLIFTLPAHCLPVVRLNGECFIADVGFGDFARCPLKFPCDCDPTKYFDNPASATAPAEDSFVIADQNLRAITPVETDKVGDRWRIAVPTSPVPANDAQAMRDFPLYVLRFRRVRFSMGEEWLDTQDSAAQQWGVAYRFSAKPYDPTSDAFKAAMCFVLGDANSPFNQKRIVMKGTPNGHLTLSERRLKTVEGNTVSEIAVQDMRHWRQLLQEKFGISLISSSSCKRVSTV